MSKQAGGTDPFDAEFPGASASSNQCVVGVVRAGSAFMTLINKTLRQHDLSAAGRETLAVLDGADGPLSPSVIAERLIVTAATMTSVIDTLERRGMVERTSDLADRRRQLVSITAAGRAAVDAFLPPIVAIQTDLMRGFTEEERVQFMSFLDRMRAALADVEPRADDVAASAAPRRRTR
jgi:DNA-binding MarR family transcriptional regulator